VTSNLPVEDPARAEGDDVVAQGFGELGGGPGPVLAELVTEQAGDAVADDRLVDSTSNL
jgi:hypothetical protein